MKPKKFIPEILLLFVILAVAVLLRFANLRTLPDWFVDEGEFIRLADYLSKGNFDYMGIRGSTLMIGRPPLFMWLLAGAFKLFRTDILVLRSLTALCGVVVIGVSYLLSRQVLNRTSAFYTAVILAILPEFIFYNRVGFTYNWLALLTVLFIYLLWKYMENYDQIWLVLACLTSGMAFASDYLGLVNIVVLALIIFSSRPSHIWKLILFAGLPWFCTVLPIFWNAPQEAWYDLKYILGWGISGWKNEEGPIVYTLVNMVQNYGELARKQVWIILGLVGLIAMPNPRLRNILFVLLSGFLVLIAPNRNLVDHYLILFWPLSAICFGNLVALGVKLTFEKVKVSFLHINHFLGFSIKPSIPRFLGSLASVVIIFSFLLTPLIWLFAVDVKAFIKNETLALPRPYFSDLYVPAHDAEAISGVIKANVKAEDFVAASGTIFWMLPCQVADFRIITVYESGGDALSMPGFDPSRFLIRATVSDAKYAVVDNFWHNMAVTNHAINNLLQEVEKWPLIMSTGNLQLYCNPNSCH